MFRRGRIGKTGTYTAVSWQVQFSKFGVPELRFVEEFAEIYKKYGMASITRI